MLEKFKYEKRYWYPHMKPRDIEIWERFIAVFPEKYIECQYDVSVGDIPQFMKERSSREGQAMQELYRLKIDVVAYHQNGIDIIELKPSAGASTIGQVVGYVELYKKEYKPSVAIQPVIVTDELKPNMEFLSQQQGVIIHVV